MKNQILFLTLFSIFQFIELAKNNVKSVVCNEQTKDRLDENVMKLAVLGDPDPNYLYPVTENEAILQCGKDQNMTEWGRNYAISCLADKSQEMSHMVTKLLMNAMNNVSKKRCKNRKVYANAGKCGNVVKSDTIKCYNQYILESEQINKAKNTLIQNKKDLLPQICCAYHKFYDCCSDVYSEPKYANKCPHKATVELEAWTRESLYSVIQYLCGDYEGSSDKCKNLRKRYSDVYNTVRVGSVRKSPLGASNEVFDSI